MANPRTKSNTENVPRYEPRTFEFSLKWGQTNVLQSSGKAMTVIR